MVLKQLNIHTIHRRRFENDVEMYGTQTFFTDVSRSRQFENDVEMYGTQTDNARQHRHNQFENDVEMYGTQTTARGVLTRMRLRMM